MSTVVLVSARLPDHLDRVAAPRLPRAIVTRLSPVAKTRGGQISQSCAEQFLISSDRRAVIRQVHDRDSTVHESVLPLRTPVGDRARTQVELAKLADAAFLRQREWPTEEPRGSAVRVADIFSGCGLMTLGVWEACRALHRRMDPVVAIDTDAEALDVYKLNFPDVMALQASVRKYLNAALGSELSVTEEAFSEYVGKIEIAVGGPPCQGHSNLNNHTRRRDPKNSLYGRMARFAEVVLPEHMIVENVPAVVHDGADVLTRTKRSLIDIGYEVDDGIVELSSIGVPQNRRRHVLLASRTRTPDLKSHLTRHAVPIRDVEWAIGDLSRTLRVCEFDKPSQPTVTMRKRIDYLFDRDKYDLPNSQRPTCHRTKPDHSYKSVYGRLKWDQPAQTITSGFGCMGQGRFVHPHEKRTLTPHEAARLQFIPDFFNFGDGVGRTKIAQMLGNAVPPKLTYLLALELLS